MRSAQRPNLTKPVATLGSALTSVGILIAVLASPAAVAEDNSNSSAECREEVWRVSVMPKGGSSKQTRLPRYEKRTVLVCGEHTYAELRCRVRGG